MEIANPKVSVLMSVYNGSDYLQEAIDSILNQTLTDFEFVIIDDCSTDNTAEILVKNSEKDSRIILAKNIKNFGLTKTLNFGLKIARGKYIARQDSDDISLPDRLEKMVESLEKNEDVLLVSCNLCVIDKDGNIRGENNRACAPELVAWNLLFLNHLAGHSQVVFRKETVLRAGGYDESYRHTQDYELWSRLSKLGKIMILPETYLKYRVHSESISSTRKANQEELCISIAKRNFSELLKREVSFQNAKALREFWLTSYGFYDFPESTFVEPVNSHLKAAIHEFVQKYKNLYGEVQIETVIHSEIKMRFSKWLLLPLSTRYGLETKFRVTLCLLEWSPKEAVWGLATWLIRSPLDTVNSVLKKVSFF